MLLILSYKNGTDILNSLMTRYNIYILMIAYTCLLVSSIELLQKNEQLLEEFNTDTSLTTNTTNTTDTTVTTDTVSTTNIPVTTDTTVTTNVPEYFPATSIDYEIYKLLNYIEELYMFDSRTHPLKQNLIFYVSSFNRIFIDIQNKTFKNIVKCYIILIEQNLIVF